MSNHVFFETVNNKNVFGVLSEPDVPQNKIVIMSHGFGGTSIGPARTFVDFARILRGKAYSVLRFDQPNSGNSDGSFIDSSFTEWIDTTTYFAKKYVDKGYEVALLGQSMGATTSMVATSRVDIRGKITCVLLWVPDPKSTFNANVDEVYEEGGQKHRGTFWEEAKNSDFFGALEQYEGGIHLVYGEEDEYISPELRNEVVEKVRVKGGSYMLLPGQDHSSWDYDVCQEVYKQEVEILETFFSR